MIINLDLHRAQPLLQNIKKKKKKERKKHFCGNECAKSKQNKMFCT